MTIDEAIATYVTAWHRSLTDDRPGQEWPRRHSARVATGVAWSLLLDAIHKAYPPAGTHADPAIPGQESLFGDVA